METDHLEQLQQDATAGNRVAERMLLLAWLQAGNADAIRDYLSDHQDDVHKQYLAAELNCFHGMATDTPWPETLLTCASEGHNDAQQVVRLYHDWARHAGQLPADHDNYDGTDANWHRWQAPDWTTVAYGNDVSVEQSTAFIPRSLISYLRQVLGPQLRPSVVVDPDSGKAIAHPVRVNRAAQWYPEALGWIGKLFETRLAATGGYDARNAEVSSLLHYTPGQQYKAHFDCIPAKQVESEEGQAQGGQRTHTLLLSLGDDVYQGGETAFPHLEARVRINTGELMRFNNTDAEGKPNRYSLHAGTPVTRGEKWLLSKWVREQSTPYGRELALAAEAATSN